MTAALDRQIRDFRTIQDELAARHYGKLALIHGEAVQGFFETHLDAYTTAQQKRYAPGSFLIRQCIPASEERPLAIYDTSARPDQRDQAANEHEARRSRTWRQIRCTRYRSRSQSEGQSGP